MVFDLFNQWIFLESFQLFPTHSREISVQWTDELKCVAHGDKTIYEFIIVATSKLKFLTVECCVRYNRCRRVLQASQSENAFSHQKIKCDWNSTRSLCAGAQYTYQHFTLFIRVSLVMCDIISTFFCCETNSAVKRLYAKRRFSSKFLLFMLTICQELYRFLKLLNERARVASLHIIRLTRTLCSNICFVHTQNQ